MSYESTAEPIKVGYLMDFTLPPGFPEDLFASFTQTFDLVFEEAVEQGLMDRPVQMIYREVEGLPKGSVKAVIDAYGELVDEGCLVVFGPNITDNCVPVREAIEERFKVPAISVTGTDDWLGEWTFAFPQGSMTDEPIFLADLVAKRGLTEIGVLVEQSLIGESYLKNLRTRVPPQRHSDRRGGRDRPDRAGHQRGRADPARGEGRGDRAPGLRIRDRLHQPGAGEPSAGTRRDSPPRPSRTRGSTRSCGTRSWAGSGSISTTRATRSDRASSTSTPTKYDGSRPEFCVTVVNRDVAATLVRAFTDAHPLSPRGVKEALERVKMMPAASGAPGTRVSLGKWTRRAWMGSGLSGRPHA